MSAGTLFCEGVHWARVGNPIALSLVVNICRESDHLYGFLIGNSVFLLELCSKAILALAVKILCGRFPTVSHLINLDSVWLSISR